MERKDYKILFQKLAEVQEADRGTPDGACDQSIDLAEIAEIRLLQEFIDQLDEPPSVLHTST